MSSTKKFEVGDRVRVVNADPNNGGKSYIGRTGVVTDDSVNFEGYEYAVMLGDDATEWLFVESELAAVDVKVVEGKVRVYGDGETHVDDRDIAVVIGEFHGDEVRITIETIRKAGDR